MESSTKDESNSEPAINPSLTHAFVVEGGEHAGPYELCWTSESSAWLVGDVTYQVGERLTIVLHIPGLAPQHVKAQVLRTARSGGQRRSEVTFAQLGDDARSWLHKLAGTSSTCRLGRERRLSPRFSVPSSAVVLSGSRYVGAYIVSNISAGGALLVGDNSLQVGESVQLLLQVAGQISQSLAAKVVRRAKLPTGEQCFAVQFKRA
jgi:hypothetical protein